MEDTVQLRCREITADERAQSRAELYPDLVKAYAEDLKRGDRFPAIVVYQEGRTYWLASGFHRYHAHLQIRAVYIEARVEQGTLRDAILFSLKANRSHGRRRSPEDLRHAVRVLLNDPEWRKWSTNEIANRCAIDWTTANKYRQEWNAELQDTGRCAERTFARGGTTSTMRVGNIGRAPRQVILDPRDVPKLRAQLPRSVSKALRQAMHLAAIEGADALAVLASFLAEALAPGQAPDLAARLLETPQAQGRTPDPAG